MSNQRRILGLGIGLAITLTVVIMAAFGGDRLSWGISEVSDSGRENADSVMTPEHAENRAPGSTLVAIGVPINEKLANESKPGVAYIAQREPNSTDSPHMSSTASPSPTATLYVDPRLSATPSPTDDARGTPTTTFTPSPTLASSRPPAANLLVNPYFDGVHNSTSIPGWVNDGHWDISLKPSNPSPPNTAARINTPGQLEGKTRPGETAVLYQVVQGGGSDLSASIACVQHYAELMQVTVLGAQSSRGPWTPVWQPFSLADCGFADWGPTVQAQTQLPQAWAFYQFQVVGRYEDERGGVKVTDASLSVQ